MPKILTHNLVFVLFMLRSPYLGVALSLVLDGQNQELTVRDSKTSGRVKWLMKILFEKTEKRVIIE